MKSKIILASTSPRRRKLLKQLGCRFQVIPSEIEEKIDSSLSPEENVLKIAQAKAEEVARKVGQGIIIAADTMVVLGKEVLGKPKNKNEARKMLKKLSGKKHQVITGLVVYSPQEKKLFKKAVVTEVEFRFLTDRMIRNYLRQANYLDKAGTYAVQEGKGPLLIKSIWGDYFNIIGLPVYTLSLLLQKLKIDLL